MRKCRNVCLVRLVINALIKVLLFVLLENIQLKLILIVIPVQLGFIVLTLQQVKTMLNVHRVRTLMKDQQTVVKTVQPVHIASQATTKVHVQMN